MAFPATPTPGQQVEEPAGSGNWFEWTPNHLAPGIGAWVPIPGPGPAVTGDRYQNTYSGATWTVGHNLSQQYVSVQCIDGAGNLIVGDPAYTSNAVLTLTFSEPVSGTAVVRR